MNNLLLLQSSSAPPPDGSPTNPFLIKTWADLRGIHNNLSKHYKLMNNLSSSTPDYSTYNGGSGFIPIGKSAQDSYTGNAYFSGTLDGQYYSISDLYISSGGLNIALFYGVSGTVKNLRLLNCSISGSRNTGGIASASGSTALYQNVGVSGNITSSNYNAGGIVADGGGTFQRCYNLATITGQATDVGQAAGIAGGFNINISISDCYNRGRINTAAGGIIAGGIASIAYYSSGTFSFNRCYSTGYIQNAGGEGNYRGGIIGYNGEWNGVDNWTTGPTTITGFCWDYQTAGTFVGVRSSDYRSTAQMKTKSNYVALGWNIETKSAWTNQTWYIDEGVDYPKLGWERYL